MTPEAAQPPAGPQGQSPPPQGGPPQGGPPQGPPPGGGMQDLSGFPIFHTLEAPKGAAPGPLGSFSKPVQLTGKPSGGYRPQIAVGPDDTLHAVYYDRHEGVDIVRYRQSRGGERWSEPRSVSHEDGRNWGPDLVARADGSLVLTWDHALEDFSSRGWLRVRDPGGDWGEPQVLTQGGRYEVGSTHVAAAGEDLAYVFIGKTMGGPTPFTAYWRWYSGGEWSEAKAFMRANDSAWHTNVEARPDGSVVAGWDIGPGGAGTEVYVADGRGGRFETPENISAGARQGERPHWAFAADGTDHVAFFHRGEQSKPTGVFVRSGTTGAWGPPVELSEGLGGFHFDPDIAVNSEGVLCIVWGWDANDEAELLYSLNRGEGWSEPLRVAEIGWGKPGLPSLDVDSDGTFHVVWNQGVRGYNEVYYASLKP